MSENNWYIIEGFNHNDFITIGNVLETFKDTDNIRILFSFYLFNIDDCDDSTDYTKDMCIDDGFEYFKQPYSLSERKAEIKVEVISRLCKEYCRLFDVYEESIQEELFGKLLNDELDFFDEEFIYSIKEYIAREINKPAEGMINFINKRRVLENKVDVRFNGRLELIGIEPLRQEYVWYEPNSRDDLFDIIKKFEFFSCIITEDVNNFEQYLYAIQCYEQTDPVLAINDKSNRFKSDILPKLDGILGNDYRVMTENEFYDYLRKDYVDSEAFGDR